MKNINFLCFTGLLATLSACSYNPYFSGKSSADIPSNVAIVRLADVEMTSGVKLKSDEPPAEETDPSKNDQEVVQIAKNAAIAQLTNFGYRVVEDTTRHADIAASLYIVYQPERWPLVDRMAQVVFRVSNLNGDGILDELSVKANGFGLVGALVGPTRDQTVGEATQDAVVKAVGEIKKGTGSPLPDVTSGPPQS